MNCREAQEEFAGMIDGEIDPERRRLVNAHLDACQDCLREFEETITLLGLCRSGEDEAPEITDEVLQRVWARISPANARKRRNMRFFQVSLAAAAILIIIAGGAFVYFPHNPGVKPKLAREMLPSPSSGAPPQIPTQTPPAGPINISPPLEPSTPAPEQLSPPVALPQEPVAITPSAAPQAQGSTPETPTQPLPAVTQQEKPLEPPPEIRIEPPVSALKEVPPKKEEKKTTPDVSEKRAHPEKSPKEPSKVSPEKDLHAEPAQEIALSDTQHQENPPEQSDENMASILAEGKKTLDDDAPVLLGSSVIPSISNESLEEVFQKEYQDANRPRIAINVIHESNHYEEQENQVSKLIPGASFIKDDKNEQVLNALSKYLRDKTVEVANKDQLKELMNKSPHFEYEKQAQKHKRRHKQADILVSIDLQADISSSIGYAYRIIATPVSYWPRLLDVKSANWRPVPPEPKISTNVNPDTIQKPRPDPNLVGVELANALIAGLAKSNALHQVAKEE